VDEWLIGPEIRWLGDSLAMLHERIITERYEHPYRGKLIAHADELTRELVPGDLVLFLFGEESEAI